jgi:hypothetical protein
MANVRLGRHEIESERLPMLCMRCGGQATRTTWKRFSCQRGGSVTTFLVAVAFGWVGAYVFLAADAAKKMTVNVPMCAKHKQHWLRRKWFTILSAVAIVGVGIAILVLFDRTNEPDKAGYACSGGLVLFILWLAAAVSLEFRAIRAIEITDMSITLSGVSEDFISSLQQARASSEEVECEVEEAEKYDEEN